MSPIHALLHRARRPGPLVVVSITYLALVSGVMIWRGISVSPDYLLLILVPVALLSGRAFAFLRDWVPFVALFLGYEALSGVAPKLGIRPQVGSMVHIERALFAGRDLSEVLQRHLGGLHWLVIACTVTCFCHFLFPIAGADGHQRLYGRPVQALVPSQLTRRSCPRNRTAEPNRHNRARKGASAAALPRRVAPAARFLSTVMAGKQQFNIPKCNKSDSRRRRVTRERACVPLPRGPGSNGQPGYPARKRAPERARRASAR